jgi:hypothetical protein
MCVCVSPCQCLCLCACLATVSLCVCACVYVCLWELCLAKSVGAFVPFLRPIAVSCLLDGRVLRGLRAVGVLHRQAGEVDDRDVAGDGLGHQA